MPGTPYVLLTLVTVWISLCGHVCNGGTEYEMRQLLDSLLNSTQYSSRVRPIQDTGNTLAVTVEMYLVAVNDIDEVEQKLTTTAYLKIQWADSFMQWDPTLHGNIAKITIPQDRIWKPDLALANAYDTINGLGDDFIYITITEAGDIVWYPYQVFESTCTLDMTYFPFDSQKCDIQLVTWSSTRDMINLVVGSDGLNIDTYESNANWDLLGTSTSDASTSTTAGLSFKLELRRKPTYYLLNFILPIVLLSILNVFVFLLPCESGEKTSYATILFLSFAIFLLIVTEIMPDGMTHVPVMSTYLLFECVMSTIIVLLTICQLRLHYQGEETPVPSFMKTFTYAMFAMKRKVAGIFKRNEKTAETVLETETTVIDDTDEEVKVPVVRNRRQRTWKKNPPKKVRRHRAVTENTNTDVKQPFRNAKVIQPVLMNRRRRLQKNKTGGPISAIDIAEYKSKHAGIEITDDVNGVPAHTLGKLNGRKGRGEIEDSIADADVTRKHQPEGNTRQRSRIRDFFSRRKKIGPNVSKKPTAIDEDDNVIAHIARINKYTYGSKSTAEPKQRIYKMVGRTSFTGSKTARIMSETVKPPSDDISGNVSYPGSKTARLGSTAANKNDVESPAQSTSPDRRSTGDTVTPTGIRVSPMGSTFLHSPGGSLNETQSSIEIRPSLAGSTTLSLYSRLTSSGRSTNAWTTSSTSINNPTPRSTGGRSNGVSSIRRRASNSNGRGADIEEVVEMCNSSIAGSVTDMHYAARTTKQTQFMIEQIEEDDEFDMEYNEVEVSWSDVTTASDIVFFIIFFTLNILATIIVFTVTAVGGTS